MTDRKPRSDKGKPRGSYKRRSKIALPATERGVKVAMPKNAEFDLQAFYLAHRKFIDKLAEEIERGKMTLPSKYYPQRWETMGEFVERQLLVALTAQKIDVNDYRHVLQEYQVAETVPPKRKVRDINTAVRTAAFNIVRVTLAGMPPDLVIDPDLATEYTESFLYIATDEALLSFKDEAEDWSPNA